MACFCRGYAKISISFTSHPLPTIFSRRKTAITYSERDKHSKLAEVEREKESAKGQC